MLNGLFMLRDWSGCCCSLLASKKSGFPSLTLSWLLNWLEEIICPPAIIYAMVIMTDRRLPMRSRGTEVYLHRPIASQCQLVSTGRFGSNELLKVSLHDNCKTIECCSIHCCILNCSSSLRNQIVASECVWQLVGKQYFLIASQSMQTCLTQDTWYYRKSLLNGIRLFNSLALSCVCVMVQFEKDAESSTAKS